MGYLHTSIIVDNSMIVNEINVATSTACSFYELLYWIAIPQNILRKMICVICFDPPEIMRSLISTKRPLLGGY